MVYKNYYINFIARIVILVATCLFFAFEFHKEMKIYTTFLLFLLIILQTILLIRFANRLNNEFYHFLELIKDKETKYKFLDRKSLAPTQISQLLNEITDLLYSTRAETEKKNLFIKFIIENADIGLFVYDKEGMIILCNKKALTLLQLNSLKSIANLDTVDLRLLPLLKSFTSANQHKQINLHVSDEITNLSIGNSLIRIEQETFNLVTIQNIKAELDEKEIESWQRIIRVLNHEIMNSIAPISSLTYSIKRSLLEKRSQEGSLSTNEIDSTINDLEVIERRGNSLTRFVDNYRKISKIELSKTKEVNLNRIAENAINLFKMDLLEKSIKFLVAVPKEIMLIADENLLEQAFINLIKNSIEALKGISNPFLEISATKEGNDLVIKFTDNGIGIPKDKIDDIFVPFYTTKENGSGIGLNLVKQIIRLHKGTIDVISQPNVLTTFTIKI